MMKIEFPTQKMIIIAGLAILIAADAILVLYAIESTTRFSRNELAGQKTQIKLLKADIKRALVCGILLRIARARLISALRSFICVFWPASSFRENLVVDSIA